MGHLFCIFPGLPGAKIGLVGVQCILSRQQYLRQWWLVLGMDALSGTVLKPLVSRIWQELRRSHLVVRSEGGQLYLKNRLNLLSGFLHCRLHDLPQTIIQGDCCLQSLLPGAHLGRLEQYPCQIQSGSLFPCNPHALHRVEVNFRSSFAKWFCSRKLARKRMPSSCCQDRGCRFDLSSTAGGFGFGARGCLRELQNRCALRSQL